MRYWPWWWSALSLAAIAIYHWVALGRLFAVSGRLTSLVDGVARRIAGEPSLTASELGLALEAATAAEFGPAASIAPARRSVVAPGAHHLVFLAGLVAGGFVAAISTRHFGIVGLRGELFHRYFGDGVRALAVLFGGGLFVGFGTRMAGGCTSGHGLTGLSRAQPGSAVATLAFFGAAVVVALLLRSAS